MARYVFLIFLVPAVAWGQNSVGPPLPPGFAHMPLHYDGPDPTAGSFLPGPPLPAVGPHLGRLPLPGEILEEAPPGPLPGEWSSEPTILPYELLTKPGTISDYKDGFFQKAGFSVGWIDRGQPDGYGITEVETFVRFAVPMPSREWPLVITPAFQVRYLNGPRSPDLPPRLYETYLDLMWLPRIGDRWMGIVAVAPSVYSDFEVDEGDAFRLTAKGLARFDWVPDRLQVLFGVLYLNREDVRVLPAGGLIWTPSPNRKYELVFPRPKLAHRIEVGPGFEDWFYLGSEFGGNSFAFDRGGTPDVLTLRDYRLFFGLERKRPGGAGHRIEIGYVFSRTAEFLSGLPDAPAPSTAFLRAGASF